MNLGHHRGPSTRGKGGRSLRVTQQSEFFSSIFSRAPSKAIKLSPLQMLLRPLIDAIQRLLKVLDGIRGTEAQITLAEGAERRSRQSGYSRVLEQRIGQLLRRPACLLDIREGIKRAFGQPAGESLDLIDATYKHVSAALKLPAHLFRLALVAAHRLDARYLGEGGCTGRGVGREARELCCEVRPHYAIT